MAKGNAAKRNYSKILIPFSAAKAHEFTQGEISKVLSGFKAFKLISVSVDSLSDAPVRIEFSNYKIVTQNNVNRPVTGRPDRFEQEGQWLPVVTATENVLFSTNLADCTGVITVIATLDNVAF